LIRIKGEREHPGQILFRSKLSQSNGVISVPMETSPRAITDIGDQQSEQQRDPAALAIERVLQAERAADAKLSECRQQAETLVAAAREQAAAIARRVDTRISQLHSAYLKKIDNAVAELAIPPPAGTGTGASDSELAKTAHRLAAKLAGDT
jgi:hypothetical protein